MHNEVKAFKNKELYKLEQGTFETFVDEMLETNTEYNQTGRMRSGLQEEEEEEDDYFDSIGDWGDMDNSFDFGDDVFGSGLGGTQVDVANQLLNPQEYTVENMGTLNMMLSAPLYAVRQAGEAVINTKKWNPKTKKMFSKDWRFWGVGLGIFSLLGFLPFITSFIYFPVGIGLMLSGLYCDYYYGKNGGESIIEQLIKGDESDFDELEDESGLEQEDEGDEGLGFDESEESAGGLGDFGGFGGFDDFGGFGDEDDTFSDRYAGHEDEEEEEEDYYDPEEMDGTATDYFPESPIDTTTTESFREGLVNVYTSGMNTKGKMLYDRQEMVRYYAKYMPNNDKAFARWTQIREHSPEYDNISYTIYKALVSINGKFNMKHAVPAGDKLTVMEMKRTPLIYKITVKLPSYFKMNDVTRHSNIFNDMLKATDDDEQVGTILTTYGGDLVIKFLRLDYRKLVAMGDLLRLSDEERSVSFAEEFATAGGIPMVAGMRDNEYPYMVDIVGNPAAVIVGGSGSGKSWLTFQFMDSMLISNNPEHLNFLILDAKDASIWKQFALAPHVIGYHSDYTEFYNILLEVKAEHERRMAELSRMGIESWKDFSSRCQRNGDMDKLADMPMLFVIIDEITYTMSSLQTENDEEYKQLKSMLTQLSSVIRASGIRLMLIGQRAIDTSIPKGYMANSPLKLAMKMNVQSDFTTMLGKGYDREVSRIPSGPGEGIMLTEGQTRPSYVKTVIPGGTSDGDILMQVRVMALDWVRRTQDTNYDYTTLYSAMNTTIKKGFNRDMYYNQALLALKEGRLTDPVTPDQDYLMAINSPNANLLDNAIENVERKMKPRQESNNHMPEEVHFNLDEPVLDEREPELEEQDFGDLGEFDWDSLLEEPELESEEPSEPEFEEPEFSFEESEFEFEEPEFEEPEFEEPEFEEPEFEEPEFSFEEPELELEEFSLGREEESELDEGLALDEESEQGFGELSLEDMLLEETTESEEDVDDTEPVKQAPEADINTMLDMMSETQTSYKESDEYKAFLQEQEEIEQMKRKQKEMLDKLQQQQDEQRRLAKQKAQEEAERKKFEQEQAQLRKQREELEQQKQEILRLQQELAQQVTQTDEEPSTEGVNETKEDEPRVKEVSKDKEEPSVKVKEPKVKTTEPKSKVTPEPKKQVKKQSAQSKPKQQTVKSATKKQPTKKKPTSSVTKATPEKRESLPNTVNYNEMGDMSVSQYIAKHGEVADGQRRVKSQIIQAKFNRRKVSVAIAVGEVYEDGDYFYYVG